MFRSFLPALSIFFLVACHNDIQTINLITAGKNLPVETSTDIDLTYSDSARIKMRLKSPRIERYESDTLHDLFPQGIHIEFYDDSLHVSSQLTSKWAIRYERLGKMEAKRDVIVFNKKGEKLNTEYLIWDEQRKIIYTNAFVKITTADEIIYGDGLESNQDFSKYKIMNIKGTIAVPDEQKK